MPPFLGQGMGSGLRDAANLAWKLSAVIKGGAPDALIDTYESERSEHVRAFIELAVELAGVIQTTDPERAGARSGTYCQSHHAAADNAPARPRPSRRRSRPGRYAGRPAAAWRRCTAG